MRPQPSNVIGLHQRDNQGQPATTRKSPCCAYMVFAPVAARAQTPHLTTHATSTTTTVIKANTTPEGRVRRPSAPFSGTAMGQRESPATRHVVAADAVNSGRSTPTSAPICFVVVAKPRSYAASKRSSPNAVRAAEVTRVDRP